MEEFISDWFIPMDFGNDMPYYINNNYDLRRDEIQGLCGKQP